MYYVLGGVAVLVAIVGGWWMTSSPDTKMNKEAATITTTADTMEKDDTMMDDETMMDDMKDEMKDDAMVQDEMKDDMMDDIPTEAQAAGGGYFPYSAAAVAASTAETIILSFSATWCPSCRALDTDITNNLSNIPTTVAIFKVDYDTNVALRQQYGVTTQHTMVQITRDGAQLKKWSGGNTLTSVLAQI